MNSCMRIVCRVAALLTVCIAIRFGAHAQTPPAALRFEVASIRPAPPGPPTDNPAFLAYRAGKATSFCAVFRVLITTITARG